VNLNHRNINSKKLCFFFIVLALMSHYFLFAILDFSPSFRKTCTGAFTEKVRLENQQTA